MKEDQLGYVINLHSLLMAIETNSGNNRSKWLTDEYQRAYDEFKSTVEKENEARNRKQQSGSPETGADKSPDQPQLRREHRSNAES